jgi:hypothetical protein
MSDRLLARDRGCQGRGQDKGGHRPRTRCMILADAPKSATVKPAGLAVRRDLPIPDESRDHRQVGLSTRAPARERSCSFAPPEIIQHAIWLYNSVHAELPRRRRFVGGTRWPWVAYANAEHVGICPKHARSPTRGACFRKDLLNENADLFSFDEYLGTRFIRYIVAHKTFSSVYLHFGMKKPQCILPFLSSVQVKVRCEFRSRRWQFELREDHFLQVLTIDDFPR